MAPAATRPGPGFVSWTEGFAYIGRTDSFAGATSAPSAACLDSVFLEVSVVGMAGARIEICLCVIVGPLVLIFDQEGDGCAQSHA